MAFIHDIEWHESDGSKEKFTESNNRFKTNGYTAAKANYSWWNPLRYIVMNHARRFGNICQLFGWAAWCSPCECAEGCCDEIVCREFFAPTDDVKLVREDGSTVGAVKIEATRHGVPNWSDHKTLSVSFMGL